MSWRLIKFRLRPLKINKVLIIGIDGCRPDALLMAKTPNMDALWKNGAFSFNARTDEISSSGPAWSAMLIGAWHQKHNILNNEYEDPDLENFPHFFHRIRQEKTDMRTYSVANWGPIHKILQEGDATFTASPVNDKQVASKVATILKSQDVDVMFVQLDEVDGLEFKNNRLTWSDRFPPFHPRKYGFSLLSCSNVEISGNSISKEVLGKSILLEGTDPVDLDLGSDQDLSIEAVK